MVYKKLDKTYISFIILIVLVIIYFTLLSSLMARRLPNPEWYWIIMKGLLIEGGVIVLILSAEAVYYYVNREAEARRAFIRLHVVLLYCTFILTPAIHQLVLFIGLGTRTDGTVGEFVMFINKAKNFTQIISVGLAHVYFILVILQVYEYKKHKVKKEEIDGFLKDRAE